MAKSKKFQDLDLSNAFLFALLILLTGNCTVTHFRIPVMRRDFLWGMAERIAEEIAEEMAKESARVSKAEDILKLLKDYGTVSSNLHDIIMGQEDSAVLQQWVKLAARADSIEAFQQAIAQQK